MSSRGQPGLLTAVACDSCGGRRELGVTAGLSWSLKLMSVFRFRDDRVELPSPSSATAGRLTCSWCQLFGPNYSLPILAMGQHQLGRCFHGFIICAVS